MQASRAQFILRQLVVKSRLPKLAALVVLPASENDVADSTRINRQRVSPVLNAARMPSQAGQTLCQPDQLAVRQRAIGVPATCPAIVSFAAKRI